MKTKQLLFLAFSTLLFSAASFSQTAPKHPGIGSVWHYNFAFGRDPYYGEYVGYTTYEIQKDTVVDGQACLKTITNLYNTKGNLENKTVGFILYEGDKAYDLIGGKKYLKYDLSAKVGDIVPIGFEYLREKEDPSDEYALEYAKAELVKIDTVQIDGKSLLRQYFDVHYKYKKYQEEKIREKVFTQLLLETERNGLQRIPPYDPTGDWEMFYGKDEKLRCFDSKDLRYKVSYSPNCTYASQATSAEEVLENSLEYRINGGRIYWNAPDIRTIAVYDMAANLVFRKELKGNECSADISVLRHGSEYVAVFVDRSNNRYANTIYFK